MKKSIIVSIFITIAVIIWFISGQFFTNKEQYSENKANEVTKEESNNKINNIKVELKTFKAENINQLISLQGQTITNRSINIKSETTGNIIKKFFIRGKKVKKDDLLYEISIEDRKELLNSLDKEFERINEEILLIKEKKENNILKIDEQIKVYQIEYNTQKELSKKGLGSESRLNLASFNLTQAKTNLKEIEIDYKSQSIRLISQLENIKSRIKNISIDIENTKIKAPFEGIIQKSFLEEGDYVRPGDIVANIVDLNPIKIQGYLSENDINKIALGTDASIEVANLPIQIGKITFISPVAETNTRTFEFIIEAENDNTLFKSGLTASININVESIQAHKISPSILSLQDNGNVGVKAIDDDNKVIFFPITKVKDTIDGMWVTGLPLEVKLIITGQEYITEGQIVEFD